MQHTSAVPREHEVGTESVWDILMHDAPTGASIPNDLSAIVLTVHHAVGSIQGSSGRRPALCTGERTRGVHRLQTDRQPQGAWLSKKVCMGEELGGSQTRLCAPCARTGKNEDTVLTIAGACRGPMPWTIRSGI